MPSRFPLRRHATGQWCKKHQGKVYYFGVNRDTAHRRYLAEWRSITEGSRRPRIATGTATVKFAVNYFLDRQAAKTASGTLSASQWNLYLRDGKRALDALGRETYLIELAPEHFAKLMASLAGYKPSTTAGIVIRIRAMFKAAHDYRLIAAPVDFGPDFRKPAERALRMAATAKDLPAVTVRRLIQAADMPLRAMILLGVNCAFGQGDCSALPRSAIVRGWHNFGRPKTGMPRRCPLWPETMAALKAVERPAPMDPADADCVFLTRFGRRFVRVRAGVDGKPGTRCDGIGGEYAKLCRRLKIASSFYDLRHTFATVAGSAIDSDAVRVIMGHVDRTQLAKYQHRVDDGRLKAVTNAVRKWLMKK